MTAPFFQQFDALSVSTGTFIKPGGRVAAYVRSTGLQEGDDLFAMSGNLVATINQGLARCRAGMHDIVYVLPGHTETHSTSGAIWPNLVAGAQIVSACSPFASNAPVVTLSHTGASVALSSANVSLAGLKIASTTAALTGAVAVTAAGVTLKGCYVTLTGALGANPAIAVTDAANFVMLDCFVVCNSTAGIVTITGSGTTDMLIARNFIRQARAAGGGDCISVASTAGISGFISDNRMKSAVAGTPGTSIGLVIGASASATVFNGENYDVDDAVTAAVVSTGS